MVERQRNKQLSLMIIGVVLLVIGLIGLTYAFFNYTRTGSANTIKVGRIAFNSNQTENIGLNNVFPISSSDVENDNTNTDSAIITITGDTTYSEGIEYLVTAVNVNNTINNKSVPISIIVTGNNLGNLDPSYYDNRGTTNSIYKVLASDVIENNGKLVVGYIKNGAEGINGSVTIKAYIDKDKIAISDTYDGNETDNMGTTTNWVDERVVLTTSEWNSLQTNGISFKVKVEANEGIWVDEPAPSIPTIASCPNCKFMYTTNTYQYGGANNVAATEVSNITETVTNDYTTLNKDHFIGFTETQDGKIDRAFACGIKGEDPNNGTAFCIEGSTDGSTFTSNKDLIIGSTLWSDPEFTLGRCSSPGSYVYCEGTLHAETKTNGGVYVASEIDNFDRCVVDQYSEINCY